MVQSVMICTVSNCGKTAVARGFCGAHYYRWQKHGDPLGGRIPNGEAARYLREVVLAYEGDECLAWPYLKNAEGYGLINRPSGNVAIVSRIVCEETNGPPPTPNYDAAHSCGRGNQGCVTKRHLSWKTRLENVADAIEHGTYSAGERSGRAKLNWESVRQIRALGGTMRQADIGAQFGVGYRTVGRILAGSIWQDQS
jgi:hypothetical protein